MYTIINNGQRVFEFVCIFKMGPNGGFRENGNKLLGSANVKNFLGISTFSITSVI
jgi:hypothetical protein